MQFIISRIHPSKTQFPPTPPVQLADNYSNVNNIAPTDKYDCCNDGADSGEREQSGREDAAEAAERDGCCGSPPSSLVSHVDHDRAEDERSVEERSRTLRGQACRSIMRRTSCHR